MFVHDEIFAVAEMLGLGGLAGGGGGDDLGQLLRSLVHGGRAVEDAAGVEVHIRGHSRVSARVAGDLDQRGYRRSNDAAAAGDEENDLRAGGDQVHDAFGVVGVRVAELHEGGVGHGVQQPQAGMRRRLGHTDDAFDRPRAALGDRAEALLLNGGEATGKVAGGDRILANSPAVAFGLVVGGFDLASGFVILRAAPEDITQADHLHGLLEDGAAAAIDQPVIEAADDGVAGEAGGPVGAAAFRAHGEVGPGHGHAFDAGDALAELREHLLAMRDAGLRAAVLLDEEGLGRAAGL